MFSTLRAHRRVGALVLGVVTAAAPQLSTARAAAPSSIAVDNSDRAKQLNVEGQRQFDSGDYEAAAESWSRILDVLPENPVNREERDNSLLITLEAYKEAAGTIASGGADDAKQRRIDVLRKAIALYDGYASEFRRRYGDRESVSAALSTSIAEVKRMLAEAERDGGSKPPAPLIDPGHAGDSITIDNTIDRHRPSGNGMIAGGAVLIALGLGCTSMIIVGSLQAKDARGDYRDAQKAMNDDAKHDADRRGRRANGLIAGGAVATGVLVAAGAALLGVGIRRRIRYQAFQPVIGPQYVGIGISGRF